MDCVFMAIYQIIHYLRILRSEPGSRERTDFHVQPTSPRMFRFVRSDTVDVFVLCFVFAFASTKTWWRWWCIDWRVWSFEIGNWPGLIARGCGCIYIYTGCMLPFDFLYDTDMRIAYICICIYTYWLDGFCLPLPFRWVSIYHLPVYSFADKRLR